MNDLAFLQLVEDRLNEELGNKDQKIVEELRLEGADVDYVVSLFFIPSRFRVA